MAVVSDDGLRVLLRELEEGLREIAPRLAVYLVYDRPERVNERPGLARAFFAQRCVSDEQLDQTVTALRDVGAYVELFHGEQPFLAALASGRIARLDRPIKMVYNGIEGGIAHDGFGPGRKALIPVIADSYGVICANSNAYACALGRHKFHYLTLLGSLGVRTPRVWHFRPGRGWAADRRPDPGTKVIAKSTYESWSVGVTEASVFVVDATCERRVAAIANEIGQAVCVQEFVRGRELCVPVFSAPMQMVTPIMEAVLLKAPGDPGAVMTIHDNLTKGLVRHRRFVSEPDRIDAIARSAARAFSVLELEAFARIDFRLDERGEAWVTDVGVSPGLSRSSSAFASVAELGFDHGEFLRIVVAATLAGRGHLPSSRARTRLLAF